MLQAQFTGVGLRRYQQRVTDSARQAADRFAEYADTGESFDLGAELRRFAMDASWRTLTGHPLDAETGRVLAAAEAIIDVLPTLPADPGQAAAAVATELAGVDALAARAIDAAREVPAGPDGPGLLHVLLEAATPCTPTA